MAQQIEIDNYGSLNTTDRDQLTADVLAGGSQIQTENTTQYAVGTKVVVGDLGTELAELMTVQTVDDATHLTFTAPLRLDHNRSDGLTPLNGNIIKVWRAANSNNYLPADDQFTVIGQLPIQPNEMVTYYTDPSGGSDYWYKFSFLNDATSFESSLADSEAGRGGGYGYYCSTQSIRRTAGLDGNQWVTNSDIDAMRLEAQQEIDATLNGMYSVPFQPPIDSMITGITRLLAAGKLMMDDPGSAGASSAIYQEGAAKAADARLMLDNIAARKYILTDVTGVSIIDPASQSSKAWPNETTPQVDGVRGGSDRIWRMSDADGYHNRRY